MRIKRWHQVNGESGFVLPVAIFALVLLSVMTVSAMSMAYDEARSGRAMREGAGAFYAAEAGLNWVFANWGSIKADVDTLSPGNSLDLGWTTLNSADSYRAIVHRWDDGGQPIYELEVQGQSRGDLGSQRTLSYLLTSAPGSPGEGFMLGECCAAAITLKGDYGQKPRDGGTILHSGFDKHPPNWEDAGVCSDSLYDKPGLIMADTSLAELDPPAGVLEGAPALVEDPTITDEVFDNFGDYTWQDVKDRADIIVDGFGNIMMADGSNSIHFDSSLPGQKLTAEDVYPRYNADGTCDTGHPMNWGSDDPNDPCFNHFPIILIKGELDMVGGPSYGRFYGQGIVIADFNVAANTGAEIEYEVEVEFRGITLGKGCIEIQKGAQYYGSVFLDASYNGMTCDKTWNMYTDCYALQGCTQTRINWSQCAVDRAMVESGLYDIAEPTVPGASAGAKFLGSRSFSESFR